MNHIQNIYSCSMLSLTLTCACTKDMGCVPPRNFDGKYSVFVEVHNTSKYGLSRYDTAYYDVMTLASVTSPFEIKVTDHYYFRNGVVWNAVKADNKDKPCEMRARGNSQFNLSLTKDSLDYRYSYLSKPYTSSERVIGTRLN